MVVMAIKFTTKDKDGKETSRIVVTEVKSIKEAPKKEEPKKEEGNKTPGAATPGTDPNKGGADNKPAPTTPPAGGALTR